MGSIAEMTENRSEFNLAENPKNTFTSVDIMFQGGCPPLQHTLYASLTLD